jgi:hypothetical protein
VRKKLYCAYFIGMASHFPCPKNLYAIRDFPKPLGYFRSGIAPRGAAGQQADHYRGRGAALRVPALAPVMSAVVIIGARRTVMNKLLVGAMR